jgi:mono/diheme cytochrome c family protein
MKHWKLALISSAFVAVAAAQSNGGDAANGKLLFTKIGCYQCHGYAGQGGRAGARIIPTPFRAQDVIRYVRRPPGEMPAYTDKVVSDQELTDIYAYMKSFPPAKQAKDIPLLQSIRDGQ